MGLTIFASKGAFRSFFPGNPKLIRSKVILPFFIRLFNSLVGSRITFCCVVYDVSPFHALRVEGLGAQVLRLSSNTLPIVRFNIIVPYVLISQSSDKFAPPCDLALPTAYR